MVVEKFHEMVCGTLKRVFGHTERVVCGRWREKVVGKFHEVVGEKQGCGVGEF